jgi:hypothetical protein
MRSLSKQCMLLAQTIQPELRSKHCKEISQPSSKTAFSALVSILSIPPFADSEAPQATLLVLSSDLAGFPLGTAKSALKLRAIFSEPVTTLDLGLIVAGNGALDSFSLKTFGKLPADFPCHKPLIYRVSADRGQALATPRSACKTGSTSFY